MSGRTAPWPIDGPELLTQVRWIVWRLEGGDRYGTTLTHRPTDRGRETIAGLTWRCYSEDYLRLPKRTRCPIEDFQRLTLDDVVTVMLEVFALRTNLWKILDPRVRLAVVDYAINAGADDAIPALQRAAGIAADGIFGPGTEYAVNAADPERLREHVMDERYQKAARVVIADHSQLANLWGWMTRFGKVLKWRAAAAALVIALLTATSAFSQDGGEEPDQQPRGSLGTAEGAGMRTPTFHHIAVGDVATTRHTHACVEGVITRRMREADGDWHLRIEAGDAFVIAEIIPQLPLDPPRPRQRVEACGITRIDKAHGWPELHPLLSWQAVSTPIGTGGPDGDHPRSARRFTVVLSSYVALRVTDFMQTRSCVFDGRCRELNPLFAQLTGTPALFTAAQVGFTSGITVALWRLHATHHRTLAWVLTWASIGAQAIAVAHNARQLQKVSTRVRQ